MHGGFNILTTTTYKALEEIEFEKLWNCRGVAMMSGQKGKEHSNEEDMKV